jgi:hypothetical protein
LIGRVEGVGWEFGIDGQVGRFNPSFWEGKRVVMIS